MSSRKVRRSAKDWKPPVPTTRDLLEKTALNGETKNLERLLNNHAIDSDSTILVERIGTGVGTFSSFYKDLVAKAAASRNIETVEMLIMRGFSVNGIRSDCTHSSHWPPLLKAVFQKHDDIAKLLLSQRADPNLGKDDLQPIKLASENNNEMIAGLLLKAKAAALAF